jgi:hypothetical protein
MDPIRRVVVALLVLQALTLGFMLSLDSLLQVSEGLFAVFLAVDLISFAVMAHTYRLTKIGETPSRYFFLAALAALLALLFSSLLVS